jgi:hypothetical protein
MADTPSLVRRHDDRAAAVAAAATAATRGSLPRDCAQHVRSWPWTSPPRCAREDGEGPRQDESVKSPPSRDVTGTAARSRDCRDDSNVAVAMLDK